ncbi:ubiquitin-protein ligase E3A-like [Montipora capricornis]|uniref:ubiquitin-protein ligase E3A-like n=1 Tax=Montipora capricornis TaxID=246305 RepID=UPI0035F19817
MDDVLSSHAVVSARPPKIPMAHSKRHSLQSTESIAKFHKLTKHSSQPKLRKDVLSGSLTSLNLDSSKKYSSLAQINTLKASAKTLSASNLAAISDSNLSLKEAMPMRSYDEPNSSFSEIKSHFEELVKCYYCQLTKGCGKNDCRNKFCFSSKDGIRLTPDVAGVMSIELATRSKKYVCIEERMKHGPLPTNLFGGEPNKPRPFLHCMFSTTPFKTFFQPSLSRKGSATSLKQLPLQNEDKRKNSGNHATGSSSVLNSANEVEDFEGSDKRATKLPSLEVKEEAKKHVFALDSEFSKLNLSGNLVNDHSLPGMPPELFSSNSSLNDVIDLEEFEKECALEMSSGHMINEFSLTHLTLPMLESSVKNYKQCKDPAFLINTIRTVFTSSQALNDSFRTGQGDDRDLLDIPAIREAYKLLLNLEPKVIFIQPFINSIEIHLASLCSTIINPDEVAQLIVLLENPLVQESQAILRKLCVVLSHLPTDSWQAMTGILSSYDMDSLKHLIQVFEVYLSNIISPGQCNEPHLLETCKALALLYDSCCNINKSKGEQFVSLSEFYNEDLSLKMDFKKEYEHWRSVNETKGLESGKKSSLLDYPFILDPTSKVRVLKIDAVSQMRVEYQNAIVHQARVQQARRIREEVQKDEPDLTDAVKSAMCPFLVLEVRRDHLIEDTLNQIHLKEFDLKKPLKIKYVGGGEQGLDMGGLQKEFFHMIVEAIFDPGYGMFTYIEESQSVWLNDSSLESEKEFELVGILLGLAIYNGVILDVRFPQVIYKKLQGEKLDLQDLMSVQPSLAKSLMQLLEFDGDVENTFCYSFQVSSSQYGKLRSAELVSNGENIPVTKSNRELFVTLYVEHLLVKSVERQFMAFSRGFHKVCGGEALTLFRPDELELLICGCPVINFHELELAATYEDGYNYNHPAIQMLWEVVNEMTVGQKKAFLMFVTGSDRVPLKGLANLTFIVQRHGEDSDRLPAALTCFNRLLLPEYNSKEKLMERLIVAIENCKGFGLT